MDGDALGQRRDAKSVSEIFDANRRVLGVVACLFIAVGVLAIFTPMVSSLAIEAILASTLITSAALSFAHAFHVKQWSGWILDVIRGALCLMVGLALAFDPLAGIVSLAIVMATFFGIDGVCRIVQALQLHREHGWELMLASGLISAGVAVLTALELPSVAPIYLSLLIGFNLVFNGIGLLQILTGQKAASEMSHYNINTE